MCNLDSSLESSQSVNLIIACVLITGFKLNFELIRVADKRERVAIMAGRHGGSTAVLLLVLVAVSAGLQCAAATTCQKVDHDALVAFKKGIKSDPTGILGNWGNASIDCCSWYSVVCNSAGHVVNIDLRPDQAFDDPSIYLEGRELAEYLILDYQSCIIEWVQHNHFYCLKTII